MSGVMRGDKMHCVRLMIGLIFHMVKSLEKEIAERFINEVTADLHREELTGERVNTQHYHDTQCMLLSILRMVARID